MAAQVLAEGGLAVEVRERMPSPGRKFLMAGRGGLNLTHSEDLPAFLARYDTSALAPHIEAFAPDALRAFAHDLGQETFVGTSGRVFPTAFKASPLLRAWLARLEALGVRLVTRSRFVGWDGACGHALFDAPGEGAPIPVQADVTVLALGGASWPRLGADGSWAPVLRAVAVPVTALSASNAGVQVGWSPHFASRHAGAVLKAVALACGPVRARGDVVVTRYGLEGGPVYALSQAVREAQGRHGTATVTLDLRPDVPVERLAARLGAVRAGASLASRLKALRLTPAQVGLLREVAGPDLPRDHEGLARRIRAVPLPVTGFAGLERAISTAGGVSFTGLTDTLMLKDRPGVFAAGEMLDWDAPTGGYLLQACFATGRAAGLAALKWLASTPPHSPSTSSMP
jgi:uncharacterized flavoprotein (TIGR03862 family)